MNILRGQNAEFLNVRAGGWWGNCCALKREINTNICLTVWEPLPRRHSHPRGITKGRAWRATRYRDISELASRYKKLRRQVRNEESLQWTRCPYSQFPNPTYQASTGLHATSDIVNLFRHSTAIMQQIRTLHFKSPNLDFFSSVISRPSI